MPFLTLNASPVSKGPDAAQTPQEEDEELQHQSPAQAATTMTTTTDLPASERTTSEYPLVKLDTEKITDATAAMLATSLLSHILFLKNQIPLPVMQLGRISNAKTSPRTLKQRSELLNSFDTISSHLETTFSALSTALARSQTPDEPPLSRAYFAFLVGPGIATAKAKIILGIDGLERRIWGTRDDLCSIDRRYNESSDSEDETDQEHDDDGEGAEEPSDSEGENSDDDDDEINIFGDAESSEHPSSVRHDEASPYAPHAEEQKFLRNADRLLSRILANADAEGHGISSEMAPTRTHILIHAPRRFIHPAWIPRQNVSATLDTVLDDFLRGSGQSSITEPTSIHKLHKQSKVEGVWITTRTGLQKPTGSTSPSTETKVPIRNEEDDLIWWSWDGKLLGFADW